MKRVTAGQILASLLLGVALPLALYFGLDRGGLDISGVMAWIVLVVIVITGALLIAEGLLLGRGSRPPSTPDQSSPPASALILAGVMDSPQALRQTVEAVLASTYQPPLQVVVAYETAEQGAEIEALRAEDMDHAARLVTVDVAHEAPDARTRAALERVTGEFVGFFGAGQRPMPDAFSRAGLWFSSGAHVVQGCRAIDPTTRSLAGRLAAIEHELPLATVVPISAPWEGDGAERYGSPYVATDVARRLASAGETAGENARRLVVDRRLVSWERGPQTLGQLLAEQQWEESARLSTPVTASRPRRWSEARSPGLTLSRFHARVWRPAALWIALQAPVLLVFTLWRHGLVHPGPLFSLYLITALVWWLALPLISTAVAYSLAPSPTRQRPSWFLQYFILSLLGYSAVQGALARAMQLGMIVGRGQWAPISQPALAREPVASVAVPATSSPTNRVMRSPGPQEETAPSDSTETDALTERLAASMVTMQYRIVEEQQRCFELEQRIAARRGEIPAGDLHSQVEDALAFQFSPEEAESTRRLLEGLATNPGEIVLLAALAEHAPVLNRVVQGYAQIQKALRSTGGARR